MKILLCLDYSSFTENVLSNVKTFTDALKAPEVTILHIIDQKLFYATTGYEMLLADEVYHDSRKLKELCLLYLGKSITYLEEYGIPRLQIDEAMKDTKYNLIIAGSHSHGLGERLLGSIAEHILRNSKIPVLIIP